MNIIDKPRKFYLFIVLSYGILLFLTLQILTWTLYFSFTGSYKTNNDVLSQQNLSLISFNIENLYSEGMATCQQIFIDKDIKKLRNGSALDPIEVTAILDRLVSYSVASPNLLSVYVYSRQSDCIYSSNASSVSSTDDFFDKGVVEIIRHITKPVSTLIPRFIEKTTSNNQPGEKIKVYTLMLCDIDKKKCQADSLLIMNFKESWISDVLKEIKIDQTSDYIFLNNDGFIVGGTKNEKFLTKLEDVNLKKSILKEHLNSFQYKINGSDYLITNILSTKLNWNIVKLSSFDEINDKIIIIRNSTMIVSLLVLLVAMLILLALSKNVQLPVVNVLNKLEVLEKEKKGSYDSLRNAFLKKFLEEYLNPSILTREVEKYGVAFLIDATLTLVLIKFDNYKLLYDTYDNQERESILLKLKEITGEEFSKCCKNEVVEYEKDCLIVITNSDAGQLDEVKMAITQLQALVVSRLGISISCVAGNAINYNEDIPAELDNIRELINYRLFYGFSSIILSRELVKREDSKKYEYPAKKEKQLFEQLLSGKMDNAMAIFHEMVEETKKYSYNSLMILLNSLVFAIHNVVEKLESELKITINFDFYSFNKVINISETLDEIVIKFMQVFEIISNSLDFTTNNRYTKIVSEVNNYIEKNYANPNLSVNLIAENMEKLPVYLNRIYKSSTSSSIQSCIDAVRLKKSMELLAGSSMSIKEISNAIGMMNEKYYYVLFKKSMGITPSEYRNRKNAK